MTADNLLEIFSKEATDFLSEPIESESIIPKTERLIESFKQAHKLMPTLQRYRELRERMGYESHEFIAPPNFTYRLETG